MEKSNHTVRFISFFWLILLGITIGFLVVEYFLKVIRYKSKDTIWSFTSNTIYYAHQKRTFRPDLNKIYALEANSQTQNELGFRINPNHKNAQQHSCVILALGDSFTWGEGVDNSQTYPFFLEKFLNKKGYQCTVHNLGVPGYSIDQKIVYLEEVIAKRLARPTHVVVEINQNDILDGLNLPLFTFKENHLVRVPAWMNGIFLQGILRNLTPRFARKSLLVNTIASRLQYIRFSGFYRPRNIDKNAWVVEKIRLQLEHLKDLSRKNNFPLIFVQTPHQQYFAKRKDLWEYNSLDEILKNQPDYIDANLEIELYIEKLKAGPTVKLEDIVLNRDQTPQDFAQILFFSQEKEPNKSLAYGWRHLNPLGQWFFARVTADYLIRKKLFESPK